MRFVIFGASSLVMTVAFWALYDWVSRIPKPDDLWRPDLVIEYVER